MSSCHTFRPVPGQCGPRGCGPLPAPPFDPQDYWATRKLVSQLFGTLETSKLDKADVVDPAAATEDGKAADAKKTQEELDRVLGVASGALALAESKEDKLSGRWLDAVNSGIDANKVAKIVQNESAISAEVSRATTEEARLQALINAIKTFDAVVADSLPTPSEQYAKKLYLVPSSNPETRNVRDEFICVKIADVWKWEQVGSTAITIEFDDEPTEGSQKVARSGGIWSWVKSLLPRWLTSDYAEPATVASVSAKANRADSSGIVLANEVATLDEDGNPTRSGIAKTDVATKAELSHKLNDGGEIKIERFIDDNPPSLDIGNPGSFSSWFSAHPFLWYIGYRGDLEAGSHLYGTFDKAYYLRQKTSGYNPTDDDEIAVKGDISALESSLAEKANSADIQGMVRETMSADGISSSGINIGGPISGQTIRDQYGDLRDAINGKVGSFASVGGASATVENGVAKLSDFFTESNSLLTGTIDARLPYPLYAVPSTGILKDRAINTTSLASVTVPDNFTDLLIRASVASSLSVTMPEAITKYGDTFPGEAGEYLITITKTGAAEAYVRTIKLEVANA